MVVGALGTVPIIKPLQVKASTGPTSSNATIAAGSTHSLALKSDGTVWGWGYNASLQLGAKQIEVITPEPIAGISGVLAVAAGGNQSMALKSDGSVWVWGHIYHLYGGSVTVATPTQVPGLTGVTAIAAGQDQYVALKSDGTVWGWGYAYLGNGVYSGSDTPGQVMTGVESISAGGNHNLAVKSDRTVWAWGSNLKGELGNGSNTNSMTPVQVSGLASVAAVAGGGGSEGHSLAMKTDGTVWAWGSNGYGQLGNGTTTDTATAGQVSGVSGASAIAAGEGQSLAIVGSTLSAWGSNGAGQLGDGSTTNRSNPVSVVGLGGVTAISGGGSHTLALKSDGTRWSWGANGSYQLANGSTVSSSSPVQSDPLSSQPATCGFRSVNNISGGARHTLAMKPDGTAWAWGDNSRGQLGNTTTTASHRPSQVSLSHVTAVAASGYDSAALTSDGKVWTWGDNANGQLGMDSGQTSYSSTPLQVAGIPAMTAVATNGSTTFALSSDGAVWGWGYSFGGALGDATQSPWSPPIQIHYVTGVAALSSGPAALRADGTVIEWGKYGTSSPFGLDSVKAIAYPGGHKLALRCDGSVWAWGDNTYGQLGIGNTTPVNGVQRVLNPPAFAGVAGGAYHSLALNVDGSMRSWGVNTFGQLGDGTKTSRTSPVPVSGVSNIVAIAGGDCHSLAVRSDGTVMSWGCNAAGQLGDGTTNDSSTPTDSLMNGVFNAPVGGPLSYADLIGGWNPCMDCALDALWRHQVAQPVDSYNGAFSHAFADFSIPGHGHSLALSRSYYAYPDDPAGLGTTADQTGTGLLRVTQPAGSEVPTQVLVDGQITDSWGLNWLKEAPGPHTVCFTHVEGWTEPACQTATITAGNTTVVTGTFTQRGSLRVITSPAVASQISVDGNPTDDWSMWTDVPAGSRTVCFGAVAGYNPPACQTATVTAGAQTTITGAFTTNGSAGGQSGVGFLRAVSSPALPSQVTIKPSAGSPYVADTWGLNWLELAPGSYTLSFSHVQGWTEPAPQTVTVTSGATTSVTGAFTQRGTLHVYTSPAVAATISIDGVPRDDWGVFTDLPTGPHSVCFGAAPGGATPPGCQSANIAAGVATDITGIYDHKSVPNGPFGYGWTFNYNVSLAVTGTAPSQIATVTQETGATTVFNQPASGPAWAPAVPRTVATLLKNGDGSWQLTRHATDILNFNTSGQLTSLNDLNGYPNNLSYTGSQLTDVTDHENRVLHFVWNGTGPGAEISSATILYNTAAARTEIFTYDASGNLQTVTDVGGGVWTFGYDTNHRMITMQNPRLNTVTNHYDSNYRVDWQEDELSRRTCFDYTSIPGGTKVSDPSGVNACGGSVRVDDYTFGMLSSVTRGYGTPDAATWGYGHDQNTLGLTATVDPLNHTSYKSYDASGNVLTATDPLGRTTTNTYNAQNQILTSTDPSTVTTTYVYDSAGINLTSVSRPLTGTSQTATTSYAYANTNGCSTGDMTSMTDADTKVWSYTCNNHGYHITTRDPLGNVAGAVYDQNGWLTASFTPKAGCTTTQPPPTGCSTTYETQSDHDSFGRVTTVTDPLSHTTVRHYDAKGNLDRFTDGVGNATYTGYSSADEPCWNGVFSSAPSWSGTKCTDAPPSGFHRQTTYNADGTVAAEIDGRGKNTVAYTYDSQKRVKTFADAVHPAQTYAYNGDGTVAIFTDNQSTARVTTNSYDAGAQLTGVSYSDGTTPNITSIGYNPLGQRTSLVDSISGGQTSTWVYDSLGRLTTYTPGSSSASTVNYGYDLKGQQTSATYPGQPTPVSRTFDDAGRMATVQDWASHTTVFGYDADSNLTSETLPNATDTSSMQDTFAFDAADRLLNPTANQPTITYTKAGTSYGSFAYARDNANRLTNESATGVPGTQLGSINYTTLSQVQNVQGAPAYSYDAADNPTNLAGGISQTYDDANQLCWRYSSANACGSGAPGTGSASQFTYDGRANRTAALPYSNGSAQTATCYRYDQQSRMTQLSTGAGSTCSTPTTTATYTYDGSGLRTSKTVGATTTNFLWDPSGGLPMLLREVAGSTTNYYIYGPGGTPLEQISGSTVLYYHQDQLGSTRAITDSAGAVKASYTYDAYGDVSACTGTTVTVGGANLCTGTISVSNPLRYTGQYTDAESGLIYLRARYYDPSTAQFISRDLLTSLTRQPYAYVNNRPLNYTDPTGNVFGLEILLSPLAAAIPDFYINHPKEAASITSKTSAGLSSLAAGSAASGIGAVTIAPWLEGGAALYGGIAFVEDSRLGNRGGAFLDAVGVALYPVGFLASARRIGALAARLARVALDAAGGAFGIPGFFDQSGAGLTECGFPNSS